MNATDRIPPKAVVRLARELRAQFEWAAIQDAGDHWQVVIDAEFTKEATARGYNVFPGPSFAVITVSPEGE